MHHAGRRFALGRPDMPANELARRLDADYGSPVQPFDLVVLLDGDERACLTKEEWTSSST